MPIPFYILARLEKKDPNYKNVEVRGCRLDDNELELLISKILANPQVETVDFSHNILSNRSVKFLSLLPETIKSLDLSRNNFNDAAVPNILNDIKIKKIDLSYNSISNKSLNCLTTNKEKTYLNVSHTEIESADAIAVYKNAQNNSNKKTGTPGTQHSHGNCNENYENGTQTIGISKLSV